jgi:hypothetical protein
MSDDKPKGPVDLFLDSSRELFSPETIVADAAMDLVKDEIKDHLKKKIKENPELARELKDAVKELLEAKAMEYSAMLRVSAAVARVGIVAVPESMRGKLAKELANLITTELGSVMEKTL